MEARPVTLLLVEDEPDLREALGEYLEASGFEVLAAGGAKEAFQFADQRQPRVLITDLSLPDARGEVFLLDFLRRFPECRAYVHSGVSVFDPSPDLLLAGFCPRNVIAKPADLAAMVLRIHNDLLFPESQ